MLVSSNPQNSSLVGYDLATDNSNNAVLTFTDIRNGSVINPFAYLISPSGTFLWGANGVTLSDSTGSFQPNPKVAVTSDGNYIFAWRIGSSPTKIYLQKLNSAGIKQWGASPILITSGTSENYDWPEITASDNGSMIMMWAGYTGSFISPSNYKLYSQKFSSAGTRVWNSTQDTVYSLGRVSGFYNPRIFSDGSNGAVYCWHDDRNAVNLTTGYVQRKNSGGTILFPVNGSAVSTLGGMNHFDPISACMTATGEVFTFFRETNVAQGQFSVFGQKFSSNGTRLWTDNGMQFNATGSNQPSFMNVFTKDTNVVVAFSELQGGTTIYIKCFRVGKSGGFEWTPNIVTASNVTSEKIRMQAAMNSSGMAMMTWSDRRNDAGGIYAQNVNFDGTLGGFSGIKIISAVAEKFSLEQNYPNPFNPKTKIRFSISTSPRPIGHPSPERRGEGGEVKLTVFDVLGREVVTLVNEELKAGTYEVDFDGSSLGSGVYYYKLTADPETISESSSRQGSGYTETRKMMLIK